MTELEWPYMPARLITNDGNILDGAVARELVHTDLGWGVRLPPTFIFPEAAHGFQFDHVNADGTAVYLEI